MRWKKFLENWDMTSLKINAHFLETEWTPKEEDKSAAWELYIELLTRITTQPLPPEDGVEETALDSIYKLFEHTRDIIKRHGRGCAEFTKLAASPMPEPSKTRPNAKPSDKNSQTCKPHSPATPKCLPASRESKTGRRWKHNGGHDDERFVERHQIWTAVSSEAAIGRDARYE